MSRLSLFPTEKENKDRLKKEYYPKIEQELREQFEAKLQKKVKKEFNKRYDEHTLIVKVEIDRSSVRVNGDAITESIYDMTNSMGIDRGDFY